MRQVQGVAGHLGIIEQLPAEVLRLLKLRLYTGNIFQTDQGGKQLLDIANSHSKLIGALISGQGLRHPHPPPRYDGLPESDLEIVFHLYAILLRWQGRQEF